MTHIFRLSSRWLLLFLSLAILFTGLMVAAYAIPDRWIAQNTANSIEMLESEGFNRYMHVGASDVRMDHFTDRWMLELALRGEEPLLRGAMVPSYTRYWHGYQVYLRPALVLGDYARLRQWNAVAQITLLCILAALLAKRLHTVFAALFGISLASVCWVVVPFSFQFSSVFLIMLVSTILLLSLYDKPWFRKRLPQFFFVVGAITVFIDFLTAPILTLGIPLVILLLLRRRDGQETTVGGFKAIFWQGLAWGSGYASLWAAKWVAASAVLRTNAVGEAVQQVLFRAGVESTSPENYDLPEMNGLGARAIALFRSVDLIVDKRALPVAVVCILAAGVYLLIRARKAGFVVSQLLPFCAVAAIPFIWLAVLGNQTVIHYYFTYRNLQVSVFALLAAMGCLWGFAKEKRNA
ncbi:MAG: hypothetical protein LBS96_10105 [Oscillospiraceae bacterium]|nr:hypothetical protein [Oscillospiraceae bacterium]